MSELMKQSYITTLFLTLWYCAPVVLYVYYYCWWDFCCGICRPIIPPEVLNINAARRIGLCFSAAYHLLNFPLPLLPPTPQSQLG